MPYSGPLTHLPATFAVSNNHWPVVQARDLCVAGLPRQVGGRLLIDSKIFGRQTSAVRALAQIQATIINFPG